MEPSDDARDQEEVKPEECMPEASKTDDSTPEECKPEVSNTDGCKPKECQPKEHKPEASEPCSFATLDWIQEVFKTIDTPLRTHRITLSYSMFSVCLDNTLFGEGSVVTRTSGGEPIAVGNANWFNFATWGTYTLGPNIRNDGAPQRLDSLPNSVRRRMAPAIIQSRSAQGDVVGRALAWGQELIFLSASRALLQFVDMIDKKDEAKLSEQFRIDDRGRAQILKSLNWSGLRFIDEGHLQLVDDAFDCYRLVFHRARVLDEIGKKWDEIQSDPDVAKLMFFATCLLTSAEQDVVNHALAVVINSVPERWSQALDGKLSQLAHWRSGVPQQVAAYNLLARLKSAEGILTEAWARLMTKYLLVIVLPTEMLRLGRNVPLRNPTEPMFPLPLMDLDLRAMDDYDPIWQNIADSKQREEEKQKLAVLRQIVNEKLLALRRFVSAFDRSQIGAGSAANDWRRFDDRMNWAICLFRSRQQDRTLYWPPYSVEDTRRIVVGEMPRASGHPGQAAVMPPLDPRSVASRAVNDLLAPVSGE